MNYSDELMNDLAPRIVFSLPLSIHVFVIRLMNMGGNHQWEAQGRDDTTPTAKEAYRRDGPFLELKDFDVELDHLVSPRPYNLMIPYCPELELLNVPQILEHKGEERLAQFTVAHCPKLKRVSRCDPGFSDDNEEASESEFGNYDGAILNLTSKSMPKNTLESFVMMGTMRAAICIERGW
jgi:hypothetical protein